MRMEKYYSVADVAEQLGISKAFTREIFKERPGVLRFGAEGRRAKRDYLMIRIPQSVIDRFVAEKSIPMNGSRAGQQRNPASAGVPA